MTDSIAPAARSKLDQRKVRQLLLSMCTSPKHAYVQMLEPDEAGALRFVSRQEAIDRRLPVYTGRLSTLDKPYPVRGAPNHFGGWCSVRFAASGNSIGQNRAQKIITTTGATL